ncbi:MAG: M23 family metallopeptidase [Bacteroidales bacterium]|nr:M23 family metallopeptidase [Bacteroidales bacterium]MCF8388697.1 M23 family metallopeptidase [Bacteroidales bacterium]MCF8398345.1 M23 family metallopeptidase [Bacteroidales bacterium]
MAKKQYRYNPKSLRYEEIRIGLRQRLLRGLFFVASVAVFSLVVVLIAWSFFDSPKERMLKREVENMKLQYEIFNDRLAEMSEVMEDLQEKDDNIYRVIFEAEPVLPSVRKAGFGGADRYARLDGYQNSDVIIETAKTLDKLTSQVAVQSESFDEVFRMAKNKAEMLASIPAIQPVSNKDLRRLSSYYGYRIDPFYKVTKFHPGLDFSAPTGTEIYATGDGVVSRVRFSKRGYGNTVMIDHGYGFETLYAHISEFEVKKGEKVKRGQLIARVGNTGKSTAPHLHYEIHKNNKTVNPIYYFFNDLTPEQFEKMLELSTIPTQTMD